MVESAPSNPASEQALRLVSESAELQFTPAELHERLIEYEDPLLEYPAEVPRPVLEIVNDSTIAVNGISIALTRTKRFILNALRLSQGFSQTGPEIREMGYEGSESVFSDGIHDLLLALTKFSDEPIIERQRHGRSQAYTLLPEVQIIDRRKDDTSPKERLIRNCAAFDQDGQPQVKDGNIVFKDARARIQVTSSLLREFKADARADQWFHKNVGKALRLFGASGPKPQRFLPRDEEDVLTLKKERALTAFVTRAGDEYTEQELACIREGARACFELFAGNLEIVKRYSLNYCNRVLTADEIYQECAARLAEMVLAHTYNAESADFSIMVALHLRQSVITKLQVCAERPFFTFNDKNTIPPLLKLPGIVEQWREEHGHMPSVAELGTIMDLSRQTVLGLLALNTPAAFLDDPLDVVELEWSGESRLIEEDFVDAQLDRAELEDAIDTIFASGDLSDNEKVVLSLQYEVFHRSLCGAEILSSDREKTFTYPYTAEDFYAILGKGWVNLEMLGTQVLGWSGLQTSRLHAVALRKARRLLAADPSFQDLDIMHDGGNALTLEEEQRRVIDRALAISPDEPLGSNDVVELSKAGRLVSAAKIKELFGSIPEFQRACGFVPKKGFTHSMNNQEIVQLALEISPDKPIKGRDTMQRLVDEGKFVSYSTIKQRFGSIKTFHEACGFKKDKS